MNFVMLSKSVIHIYNILSNAEIALSMKEIARIRNAPYIYVMLIFPIRDNINNPLLKITS